MTPSTPPDKPMTAITLSSSEDTELFLVSGNYTLVANGVGSIVTSQPPGLYKVRALRAGVELDQIVEIRKAPFQRRFDVAPPQATGPSPDVLKGQDAITFFEYVAGANPPFRKTMNETVYITVSEEAAVQRHPLRGLRIFPWGNVAAAQALLPLRRDTLALEGKVWAVARIDLSPGTYVIEAKFDDRAIRTVLPVPVGRETHINIRRRAWVKGVAESATPVIYNDPDGWRSEWIDLAIEYATSRGRYKELTEKTAPVFATAFVASADSLQLRNSLRTALAQHRKLILDERLINKLLNDKFDDPYVGIAAAHLMLDAMEAKATRSAAKKPLGTVENVDFSPAFVDLVLTNLQGLLGGRPNADAAANPDLAALLLRANSFREGDGKIRPDQIRIDTAPLYWRSWEILLNAALGDPAAWIDPSLWRETKAAEGWGCTLVWTPHRMSLEKYLDLLPRTSFEIPRDIRSTTASMAPDTTAPAFTTRSALSPVETQFRTAEGESSAELRARALQYRIPLSVISKG